MPALRDLYLGAANAVETAATTNLPGLWHAVHRFPPAHRQVNKVLVNRAILKVPTRPHPLSTLADYTSWASLSDRSWDARHLPPADGAENGDLPAPEAVARLFAREGEGTPCPKSTVLFPYFAEWFVDGFLRSERPRPDPGTGEPVRDPARNESNHEIDLMQLYGLTPDVTAQLRLGEGGRLRSQEIHGEEYPPYLYDENLTKRFDKITVARDDDPSDPTRIPDDQRRRLFAIGSDTGNLQLGFVMMSVLFLREHNRLARELEAAYGWDDERIFQTARNILTVLLIKIVVEEYINHISPYHFRFVADPTPFRNPRWYRQNWMAIEFNLLYRWHSLVPTSFRIRGEDVPVERTLFNTQLVTDHGLAAAFEDASAQRAGKVGLFNSPPAVLAAERASIATARQVRLRPYAEYRVLARFPRPRRFADISASPRVQGALRELYGEVDRVEFVPGLFAEDTRPNSVLPPLIGRLVGIDAFSQAFTNPLLAQRVFREETFSPLGWKLIHQPHTLSDLLHRNIPDRGTRHVVTMTRPDWMRA